MGRKAFQNATGKRGLTCKIRKIRAKNNGSARPVFVIFYQHFTWAADLSIIKY